MKKLIPALIARVFPIAGVTALSVASTFADVVVVESRTGSATTAFPPYGEITGNWANSTLKSSAPGTTSARGGSRFMNSGSPSFKLRPTLGEAGGTYYVEVTHGSASSISADLIMGISTLNGSGLPSTTDGFQQSKGVNAWYRIGTLTLDPGQTAPTITFTYSSGTIATTGAGRCYADAFRFINTNTICITGLPELSVVNGPLAAGQTSVDVPGISGSATNVSVYADNVLIGQKSSAVVAGVNTVITSPLVKGQQITVSQWANGIESCRPTMGTLVGGGANPRIRVALSIRQNTGLGGPIGADGGTGGTKITFLGSSGVVGGGFGNAPSGGRVVLPSTCWQTVSFLRGADPSNPADPTYNWSGSDGQPLLGDFGVLESVALAIDDLTDTGPFQIYIDNLMNGSTVIQDFESFTNGSAAVQFTQPSFSGSTTPFLLAQSPGTISPNISQVSNANADAGTNSALISWQFKDTAAADWLRLTSQGAGTPNPQVDLRLPISLSILVLPVGQTVGQSGVHVVSQPASTNVAVGEYAAFAVQAFASTPITYQWQHNGVDIPNESGPMLELFNVQPSDAGYYQVIMTGPSCSATSRVAGLGIVGNGNGLSASFYSNQDRTFTNPPTLVRLDSTVNYDWGIGSPDPSISADHFTARWGGQVQPTFSETYTFYTTTDDGVRLWVNGVLLIDKWIDQGATEWSGSIPLTAGQKYDLVMEFYENAGGARAELRWSSAGQSKSIIPQSQLYTVAPNITVQPSSLTKNPGETGVFEVTATGTPVLYQWNKNGAPIFGADSSSYTINPVHGADAGDYTVLVRNGAGSVTSFVATLTVSPEITVQPASQIVPPGSNATFSVTATGTAPLSYQWKKDGTDIMGATSSSYTINDLQFSDGGSSYRVLVSNSANSLLSDAAILTVDTLPVAGSDTVGTTENHSVSVSTTRLLANDSDADGDALTISSVSSTSAHGGMVSLSGGTVTYTPANNFSGADPFTYTLSDTRGGVVSGTVLVTVRAANAPSQNQIGNPVPAGNGLRVRFAGIPGRTYGIERSVDSLTWSPLSNVTADSHGLIEYEDASPPSGALYRTVAP